MRKVMAMDKSDRRSEVVPTGKERIMRMEKVTGLAGRATGLAVFITIMSSSACNVEGIEFLPPEELHPVSAASSDVAPSATAVVPGQPAASQRGASAGPTPARQPARAPATAAATPRAALAGTCDKCHPLLSTIEQSGKKGDEWSAVIGKHVSNGYVELTPEERSSIVSQLKRRYR